MYPVVWRDKTFQMSNLTVDVKNKFVAWGKMHLTKEGIENLGQRPDLLTSYLANLYGELWWGDGVMSKPVATLLNSPAGGLQLNRLLFGDSAKILSDSDFNALLDEKEAEPHSDYMVAMGFIRENADPKARAAATGADPPGVTNSTATTATNPFS